MRKFIAFIRKNEIIFPIIILLGIVIFIINKIIFLSPSEIYKENWGIDIPNPKKNKYVINVDSIDATILEVMYYSTDDIEELKDKEFFKKIEDNEEEFFRKYVTLIKCNFMESLTNEQKDIFNKTLTEDVISNKDNYYALLEKDKQGYNFTFLILDIEKNIMYSIIMTS